MPDLVCPHCGKQGCHKAGRPVGEFICRFCGEEWEDPDLTAQREAATSKRFSESQSSQGQTIRLMPVVRGSEVTLITRDLEGQAYLRRLLIEGAITLVAHIRPATDGERD